MFFVSVFLGLNAYAWYDIEEPASLSLGLSVAEAAKLCNYLHFREAEKLPEKSLLQKANLNKSIDFLDTVDEDIPKGTRTGVFRFFANVLCLKLVKCRFVSENSTIAMLPFGDPLYVFNRHSTFTGTSIRTIFIFVSGSWSLQFERGSGLVTLRSLLWLGYSVFHVPGTSRYGSIYVGTGEKNMDLPFML